MKRHGSLIILATCVGISISLLIFMQARAQIDGFTFFVPFPADQLDDLFDAGSSLDFVDDDIVTTISIAVRRNDTVIYYDHWEDDLEGTLTAPDQPSTQVWGDGNPGNGVAPTVRQPNPDDRLQAGDVVVLQNTVVLPRDPAQLFFDGGDNLSAVGGSIAVTLAVWPESASSLYAAAWALGSTGIWGREYVVPVGEDIAGTGPDQRPGFRVVGINVQAAQDNTVVELDLDGDGTFEQTQTLNKGGQFITERGGVQVGARVRVQSGGPVQVQGLTADPDVPVPYEARGFGLLPLNLLANDYLAPRSSDGDHWLHNPHTTPLTVTAVTATGITTLTVPAGSTIKYPPTGLSGPTGVRFTSTDGRPFDGITTLSAANDRDWGYGWAPVDFLTTQVLIGWAPGNNRVPPSSWTGDPAGLTASRVYVTALTTTTLNIEYDLQDPIPDDTRTINPLEEVDIFDPNDYDMTGAVLYTTDGVPFSAVWGQDETAPLAEPSLDVGTGILPLASLAVQKTITLVDDADGSGDISWGDTLRFHIFTVNNTNLTLQDAVIFDPLPSTVDYVARSGTVRGAPIPDDSSPRTVFPFDEGGYLIGDLGPTQVVAGTYDAVVKEGVEEICNTAEADSPSVPGSGEATACTPVQPSIATPAPEPEPEPEPEPTSVPPTPIPTSTPLPAMTPTPLPVVYLPETGAKGAAPSFVTRDVLVFWVIGLAILGLVSACVRRGIKQAVAASEKAGARVSRTRLTGGGDD